MLFKKPPQWVMVAELVETNRLWGRVAARIHPSWAEELGAHLVKRSYGEPWWDERRGAGMVDERVTLHGLPLVTGRRVPYARVAPEDARDMFIHHALVEGSWTTSHAFVEANRKLVEEVRALEDRARRRDILVSGEALFDFYDRRVGPGVTSTRHFDRWWKEERRRHPDLLTFTVEDVVDPAAGGVSPASYPDVWRHGDLLLPLHYEFDPTSDLDGVTVDVPLPRMDDVDPAGFAWQVPGLREELVTALIRTLPKSLRRQIGAAGDHARAFLRDAGPGDGPLDEVLARYMARRTGERITAADWDLDRVHHHLRVTFRIVSERGTPLAWSKDLPALRAHLRGRLRAAVTGATRSVEQAGLTSWTIGELPRTVTAETGGHTVTAHPALVDEGDSVAVRTFATVVEQRRAMWAGTRRLLLLTIGSPVPALQRLLRNETKLALAQAPFATAGEVLDDCVTCALDDVLARVGGPVWDEPAFRRLCDAVRDELVDTARSTAVLAGRIITQARAIEARLDAHTSPAVQPALTDIHVQVARLVHEGFVTATGSAQLAHLPRYLQAIDRRLDRLARDPYRDRAAMQRVQRVEEAFDRIRHRRSDPEVTALRWSLEELRVSVFAQSLGTPRPVSEQRILKEIARIS